MYKVTLLLLIIISYPSFAKSKCQFEWDALKKVQAQLRHKSSQRLRDLEHKKHSKYQSCRKGKTQTARNTIQKVNLENLYHGKKKKAWKKYYKTPQYCKKPSTEKKLKECIRQRDKKAYHFERVWNSKIR